MNVWQNKFPRLIAGKQFVDDRGTLNFVNDFQFEGVKRHYIVHNHKSGFVRAWHAHKNEAKYVTMARGSAIVGAVKIDDWEHPDKDANTESYVLSACQPAVLYIPAGYANGWCSLTDDSVIMFFSTTTAEESKGDDYRFPARYWDIWGVEER